MRLSIPRWWSFSEVSCSERWDRESGWSLIKRVAKEYPSIEEVIAVLPNTVKKKVLRRFLIELDEEYESKASICSLYELNVNFNSITVWGWIVLGMIVISEKNLKGYFKNSQLWKIVIIKQFVLFVNVYFQLM